MIGAAASGKSTAARILACALQKADHPPVRYISSSAIRHQLYGLSGGLGSWVEVEAVIQQELCEALAAGETAIVEASYSKRAFRLAITQAMAFPQPVQWIGWWLDTPQPLCLQWNQERDHPVPETVIRRQCAQLLQSAPVPHRKEGFSQVVRLQTGQDRPLSSMIQAALAGMEATIVRGANRDATHELHGYSRLLDQERLLYLVQLLCQHPKLTVTGCPPDPELDLLLSPLPAGGLAEKAAAILARLHGACYGDVAAISCDLDWLEGQGFTASGDQDGSDGTGVLAPIQPPTWPAGKPRPMGGLPRLADREAFCQAFTVLRHLLHHPYAQGEGERINEHIAAALTRQSGGRRRWQARQIHTAISDTLTPYGFRRPGRSGRRGFALGTALLSIQQLQEACQLLQLQAEDLGDRSAAALSSSLRERLQQIGADPDRHAPRRRWLQPHRPLQDVFQAGRAAEQEGESVIEAAIRLRQKLLISQPRAQPKAPRSPAGSLMIWPLQLLLNSGRWWLLHEHAAYGTKEGLLACTPLDGLYVFQAEQRSSREEAAHRRALQRAMTLQQLCGGLWFGVDLAQQQALVRASAEERRKLLSTLRLRCAPAAMTAIRRDLERFQPGAIRLSAPLPGDSWGGTPSRRYGLQADDDPLHPYPVEIDLPDWVLEGDHELRRWLLAYGPGIRLEAPTALVEEHRSALAQALALYTPTYPPAEEIAAGPESPAPSPKAGPINPAASGHAGALALWGLAPGLSSLRPS
ncbi:MAG: AAA family ATPase [Synechococcaceae cyanobacterium ELA263]